MPPCRSGSKRLQTRRADARRQVFVSSTWLDLQPGRIAVATAVQRLRETKFVGMEHFGSREETTRAVSLAVDRSRVYVGSLADVTGRASPRPVSTGSGDRPAVLHLLQADSNISDDQRDKGKVKGRQLARLKWNCRAHTVGEFTSPDDLAAKLTADLHSWLMAEYLTPKLRRAARARGVAAKLSLSSPLSRTPPISIPICWLNSRALDSSSSAATATPRCSNAAVAPPSESAPLRRRQHCHWWKRAWRCHRC